MMMPGMLAKSLGTDLGGRRGGHGELPGLPGDGRGGQPLLPALRAPDRDGRAVRALPGRAGRRRALLLGLRPGGARRLAPAHRPAGSLRRRLHEPGRRLDRVSHLQRPPRFLRGRQCHPLSELRFRPARHRSQAGPELLGRPEGQGRGRGRGGAHRPAPGARGGSPALLRALLPADRPRLPVAGRAAQARAGQPGLPGHRREPGWRPRIRPAGDRHPARLGARLGRRRPARPQGRRCGARSPRRAARSRSARSTWRCSPRAHGPLHRPRRDPPPMDRCSSSIATWRRPSRPRTWRPSAWPPSACGPRRSASPLFERSALAALGTIVAAQLAPERAMTQGLAGRGFEHVIYRQVLGRILSVIYFPFWVVELAQDGERWLTVVDGVAESVVQPRAPAVPLRSPRAARERRAADGRAPPPGLPQSAAGPCRCEPDDVIFFCGSCHRAWQIHGVDLTDMPHEIADIRPDGGEPGPRARRDLPAVLAARARGRGRGATRLGAGLPLPPAQGAARPGRAAHREAPGVSAVDRRAPRGARVLLRRRGRGSAGALRGGGPAADRPAR